MEMDSATGSIYLADPGVDRHHRIIRNRHSFFPSSWSHTPLPSFHRSTQFVWLLTHSYQAFIEPLNLCGSSQPGIPSYPLNVSLRLSSQNGSFLRIVIGCYARCGGVLMMSWLTSSSTVSPHRDRVNLKMHSDALIVGTWRLWLSEFGDTYQQNVKWFASNNSMTQLFWTGTLIHPEAPRSSRTGWMQNNVLLTCSETYFQVLLNAPEVAEQNTRMFYKLWSHLQNAIK